MFASLCVYCTFKFIIELRKFMFTSDTIRRPFVVGAAWAVGGAAADGQGGLGNERYVMLH